MEPRKQTAEDRIFNPGITVDQRKQMLGMLHSWWGKLTDGDWSRIGEEKEKLLKVLQERYGYTHERAQQEVNQRFQELNQVSAGESVKNQASQMKVMGRADGSRTTTGGQEPNTTLSSRAEPSTGAMGNAAGLPDSDDKDKPAS